MNAIDADGHVTEPDSMWLDHLDPALHAVAPRRFLDNQGRGCITMGGHSWVSPPRSPDWPTPRSGGADPKARIADMDDEGVDLAVLFPTTGLFFAGVDDPGIAHALCVAYNDWLAGYCAAEPSRLVAVGLLPQADVRTTIAEAHRTVRELDARAVVLRPNPIGGRNLDDPAYEALWSELEDLGVPVVLHEGTTMNVVQSGDRFENFAFRHACSHPHEQQYACLSLVCGGVLERHPGLRVLFVEAGCGWLPYWLERLDENMEEWAHSTAPLALTPSEYFARQCYVTTEPDERGLPAVVELLGDDNIMFATDYPHPDAIFPGAVRTLAERDDLSDSTKTKILRTNAARCFGLAKEPAQ